MRFNPCGRVVDFARRTYETKCRFFGEGGPEITIKWFKAAPDAEPLPYPTPINSLDWYTEPWTKEGPGEVWGAPRPFRYAGPPAGGPFSHLCGTREDFERGGVYDPVAPPVIYAANGLPVCCAPDPDPVAVGGFDLGGTALVRVFPPGGTEGGIDLGGTAVVTVSVLIPTSGGFDLGGTAVVSTGGGFDPCDIYSFVHPVSGQTVFMYLDPGAFLWRAIPFGSADLTTVFPGDEWFLFIDPDIDARAFNWTGQGSKEFTWPGGSVVVSCAD